MFVARVSFAASDDTFEGTMARAYDLLSCWYKNGQIAYGTWMLVRREGRLEAFVRLAEPDSLETRHNNSYSTEALAALSPIVPDVEILGPVPESSTVCACVSRSAMVLFTHYLSTDSPVRCLDCFALVPLYSLPHVHDEEHLVLLHWASDYRACDTLQMHCTTGERFAEEQLARHDSSLSANGRDLCRKLEQATRTPVYYFLHKTRSRGRRAELGRICPSCGGQWRLEKRLHNFDFQCASCRLLSAIAADAS
jgi:predicted  nucleic acid-binding Zn ribbon protein